MRTWSMLLLLAAPALAGCLAPASTLGPVEGLDLARFGREGGAPAPGVLHWVGKELEGNAFDCGFPLCGVVQFAQCMSLGCELPECTDATCETTAFTLDFPPGFWDPRGGGVQVRAQSVANYTVGVHLEVLDDAGEVVARGETRDWVSVALLEKPSSGTYHARVQGLYGEGRYEAAVLMHPAPAEAGAVRELLPNLRTITPYDLRIERPDAGIESPIVAALGVRGCGMDEALERRAARCLRLSNGVANVGEGPLEVWLAPEGGALSAAGQGEFIQRLYASDGTWREVSAGRAAFHPTHRHIHYEGLANFALYAYDPALDQRGELVREGRKSGFCFYDTALHDLRAPAGVPSYSGARCFRPVSDNVREGWVTGISPGYLDYYNWELSDQYVEISGVPDGVYEVESVANGLGRLAESDTRDNAASIVFELRGDEVHVLGVPPLGRS